MTIHQLLTHSSGIPSDGSAEVILGNLTGAAKYDWGIDDWPAFDDHVRGADGRVVAPGERFMYYNTGYTVLGRVIEAVSGVPYAESVERRILEPLGTSRSTVAPPLPDHGNLATGYYEDDGELAATEPPAHPCAAAAGGLFTTAEDAGRYLRMLLNGGSLDGQRLVSTDGFEAMTSWQVDCEFDARLPNAGYGYGWCRKEFLGTDVVAHPGNTLCHTAAVGFTDRHGVAVLCNGAPSHETEQILYAVLALPNDEPKTAVPYFALDRKLDRLTGEYATYRDVTTARITRETGHLRFETEGFPFVDIPLLPESTESGDYRFYSPTEDGGRDEAVFRVGDDGVELLYGRQLFHRCGPLP